MPDLEELYSKQIQQEKFATLVATRVGSLLDGEAKQLAFTPSASGDYTSAQETMMYADLIARSVVNYLHIRQNTADPD